MPVVTPVAVHRRALVPHEHGAYGQLAMPLLTGLAIGRPGGAALALTATFVLAFFSHEPLLVALGRRGKRSREEDGERARRLLAWQVPAVAVLGTAGAALAPPLARAALAVPAALAALVLWLVFRGLERTTLGEVAAGAALSSGGLAVALAAGARPAPALTSWLVWALSFALATLAVQAVLVRAQSRGGRDPGLLRAALCAAILAAAFVGARAAGLPAAAPLALLPGGVLAIAVCLARVSPKRLRALGWALVGSSVVTMALLVAGLRAWP